MAGQDGREALVEHPANHQGRHALQQDQLLPGKGLGKQFGSWWRHQMETFSALLTFVRGIHRWPVNSPHKGQWRGALMFSLICTWANEGVNDQDAGDLRRHRAHYGATVMWWSFWEGTSATSTSSRKNVIVPTKVVTIANPVMSTRMDFPVVQTITLRSSCNTGRWHIYTPPSLTKSLITPLSFAGWLYQTHEPWAYQTV